MPVSSGFQGGAFVMRWKVKRQVGRIQLPSEYRKLTEARQTKLDGRDADISASLMRSKMRRRGHLAHAAGWAC